MKKELRKICPFYNNKNHIAVGQAGNNKREKEKEKKLKNPKNIKEEERESNRKDSPAAGGSGGSGGGGDELELIVFESDLVGGDGGGSNSRVKRPWSPEEDTILSRLVEKFGARNWSLIARGIPGRSGKSCRLRWCN